MQDNEFFVVDMASCSSTGEIINSLTLALETLSNSGKKIILKLNDSKFNQSQMLSIQSLIASYGCILDTVETTNPETAIIVENMNIFVQEPIERRVDNKYDESKIGFETFSMTKNNDDIALKDVNGLHFEADLDAIQKNQESINISSDLENAGINPRNDFEEIGKQVIDKYSRPDDSLSSFDKFSEFSKSIEHNIDEYCPHDIPGISDEAQPASEFSSDIHVNEPSEPIVNNDIYQQPEEKSTQHSQDQIQEPSIDNIAQTAEYTAPVSEPVAQNPVREQSNQIPVTLKAPEKNTIGVYKKAYDEFEVDKEDWEEVDFYETPTNDPVISDTKNTVYINQTLRSGQILESDGNVVIIGDCHPGSEIRAVGDITVWGVLSGIAHAGYKGNINAKVRALKMNAVQLRIGSCYSRRPDSTNIPYIIKTSVFTPEEARAVDDEIMLFKINQNQRSI